METFLDTLKRKYLTNYQEYVEFYKETQSKIHVVSNKYSHQRFVTFLQEMEKLKELLGLESGIGLYGESDKSALALICLCLSENTSVKEVGLTDCLPQNLGLLVDTLNSNKHISILDIDLIFDTVIANNLLAGVNWAETKLYKIYLGWVTCQYSGISAFCKSISRLASLKELCLVGCDLTDDIAPDIKSMLIENRSLEDLDLSNNKFGSATITAVVEASLSAQRIKKLDLSSNYIDDHGMFALGLLLAKTRSIKEFKLDHYDISTKGMVHFAKGLSRNTTLSFLSLEILLNGISRNVYLKELVLNRREDYDGELFCKALGEMLAKNKGLKSLVIFRQAAENEQFILQGLQKNFYLLDLSGFDFFNSVRKRNIAIQTSQAKHVLIASRLLQMLPLPHEIIELIFTWKCAEALFHPTDNEKLLRLLDVDTIGQFDLSIRFTVESFLNQIN
ncbi:hypothetical protein HDV04_000425 [Boothiomyces sp. JEL0838]|nr:hypothetical protein HDV04_000405 [Boothiomyces sp. JEL0838]KAJ3314463.1 hypothetical protein HDV04_000425 [Boothiomyces sp. JEL0838]